MSSKIATFFFELDFLREKAYVDKTRSRTRLILTVILLLLAAVSFVVLAIYKSQNRAIIIVEVESPSYAVFQRDLQKQDSLVCFTENTVTFSSQAVEFGHPASEAGLAFAVGSDVLNNAYDTCTSTTYLYQRACIDGVFSAYSTLATLAYGKGLLFISESELSDVAVTQVAQVALTSYSSTFSNSLITTEFIRQLVAAGSLTGNLVDVTNYQTQVLNQVSDPSYKNFFIQGAVEILIAVELPYENYYNNASVTKCQYNKVENALDVISYAANFTHSLFTVFVVLMLIVHKAVRKVQKDNNQQSSIELAPAQPRQSAQPPPQVQPQAQAQPQPQPQPQPHPQPHPQPQVQPIPAQNPTPYYPPQQYPQVKPQVQQYPVQQYSPQQYPVTQQYPPQYMPQQHPPQYNQQPPPKY